MNFNVIKLWISFKKWKKMLEKYKNFKWDLKDVF